MPLGQSQDIPQADPGGRVTPRFWHRLIRFRHFIDGSLALASLNRACRNLVPAFPQRSPPSLLSTAACGGLRSTPDCRPRRVLLHLSYSSAPSYSDGARDTRPRADVGLDRLKPCVGQSSLTDSRLDCVGRIAAMDFRYILDQLHQAEKSPRRCSGPRRRASAGVPETYLAIGPAVRTCSCVRWLEERDRKNRWLTL